MFKLRGLHNNKKPGGFFDNSLAIITAFFMILKKMNLALGQNDRYLCYISAIWEEPLCVMANRSLYICIHRFMNPWMSVSLYPRIHVSPHLWLLGFSYSWTSLNPYPSVVRWTVWAMVYEGLWANRGMVKKQILKVRKKMQKIIKEM